MLTSIARPDDSEFAPYYATYINMAAAALSASTLTDISALLAGQNDELETLLKGVTDDEANRAYAAGKWTLKESLVHVFDAERVFTYRAACIARGDKAAFPSFDQDAYVPESRANARSLANILAEFRAIRLATLALLRSFDAAALAQIGTASGQPVTPRALCWIIAGHAAHHMTITRERYLAHELGSEQNQV